MVGLVSGGLKRQLISASCRVSPPIGSLRLISSRQQVPRESSSRGPLRPSLGLNCVPLNSYFEVLNLQMQLYLEIGTTKKQ